MRFPNGIAVQALGRWAGWAYVACAHSNEAALFASLVAPFYLGGTKIDYRELPRNTSFFWLFWGSLCFPLTRQENAGVLIPAKFEHALGTLAFIRLDR